MSRNQLKEVLGGNFGGGTTGGDNDITCPRSCSVSVPGGAPLIGSCVKKQLEVDGVKLPPFCSCSRGGTC